MGIVDTDPDSGAVSDGKHSSPTHSVVPPDHVPVFRHVRVALPLSSYPSLHPNVSCVPVVPVVPDPNPFVGIVRSGAQGSAEHRCPPAPVHSPSVPHVRDADPALSVYPRLHSKSATVPDVLASVDNVPNSGADNKGHVTTTSHAGGFSRPGVHVTHALADPSQSPHCDAHDAHVDSSPDHEPTDSLADSHVRDVGPTK